MTHQAVVQDIVSADVCRSSSGGEHATFGGVFKVTCFGADGALKWSDEFPNLVVNEGLQYLNNAVFKGVSYNAAWYLGLIYGSPSPTYAATDSLVGGHPGWIEFTSYVELTRIGVVFNSATNAAPSVVGNAGTPCVFTISGLGGTVGGAFLSTSNVKSGVTGTLFSEANFVGGNKVVNATDTLNVTYTFSAASA